ncbi:MAG: AraC family transcriptional regulator [Gammaproteobacteria bacterium]|nr:AraC family transcriptional regulator [Gammaproteobacteria bacterium]
MQETTKITSPQNLAEETELAAGKARASLNAGENTPIYHTSTIGLFRGIIDYCRQNNIEMAPVLAEAGLTEDELQNIDNRIPIAKHQAALAKAYELSNDPDFAMHYGESVKPGHYGVVGLVAMSCEKAGELLELHIRYQSLVADGVAVEYQKVKEGLALSIHAKVPELIDNRLHQESTFASWISLARWITGLKDHYPLRANFTTDKPENTDELHRVLGPNLYWNQPICGAVFDSALLESPLPQANPALRKQLESQVEQQLIAAGGAQFDPLLQQVQSHISKSLADGVPDIEQVASALNLSTRALQRKLSDLDTSFSQMLDNTRKELALNYIRQAHISLTEVAFLLGFSEQSAFNRAFKRWTEQSPSAYRKSLAGT